MRVLVAAAGKDPVVRGKPLRLKPVSDGLAGLLRHLQLHRPASLPLKDHGAPRTYPSARSQSTGSSAKAHLEPDPNSGHAPASEPTPSLLDVLSGNGSACTAAGDVDWQ